MDKKEEVKREIKQKDGTTMEEWVSVYERNPPLSRELINKTMLKVTNDHIQKV